MSRSRCQDVIIKEQSNHSRSWECPLNRLFAVRDSLNWNDMMEETRVTLGNIRATCTCTRQRLAYVTSHTPHTPQLHIHANNVLLAAFLPFPDSEDKMVTLVTAMSLISTKHYLWKSMEIGKDRPSKTNMSRNTQLWAVRFIKPQRGCVLLFSSISALRRGSDALHCICAFPSTVHEK